MNLQAVLFDFYNTLIEIRTMRVAMKSGKDSLAFFAIVSWKLTPRICVLPTFREWRISKTIRPEEHAEIDVVDIFRQMLNEMGYRQESTSFPEELTQLFRTLSIVRFAPFPETFRCWKPCIKGSSWEWYRMLSARSLIPKLR